MKKVLLSTVALVAFAAPAAAADLAARPYIKAPPAPIAVVYDWSGFYIGANGGWGSSRKCWDFMRRRCSVRCAEGCHDATGGTAGGQIGYRWQAGTWVFGLEAQGNWADFQGSNVSLDRSDAPQRHRASMRSACSPVRSAGPPTTFCSTSRAVRPLPSDRFRISDVPHRPRSLPPPAMTPAGAAGRRRPRIRLRPELDGRHRIQPPVHAGPHPHLRRRRPAPSSAPIASVRTSISSPSASTIAGVAR